MTVLHDDQGINLQHRHVLVDEGLVEDREQALAVPGRGTRGAGGRLAAAEDREQSLFHRLRCAVQIQRRIDPGHIGGSDAGLGVDDDGLDLLGRVVGDRLNVHAALGRDDEGHPARRAVNQQRAIEFALDVGTVLDIEAIDLFAGRAGLGGDQGVAQHLFRMLDRLLDREGQADAALGISGQFLELALAAAAGVDLGFNDIQGAGQLPRSRLGLVGRGDGDAFGDRCAKALQDLFGLIFVDVHGEAPPDCWEELRRL